MSVSAVFSTEVKSNPQLTSCGPNWFAAYTAVNQEKQVADRLTRRGIENFLPLYRTIRRRSDRKVELDLPLFPGYLFVRVPAENRLRVLEVPHVVRILGSSSVPTPIPAQEIEVLQTGLARHTSVQPCPYLTKGCRVRIVRGPFAEAEGVLLRHKHGLRVVVSIHLIARSFIVEVEETDLERVL